MKGLLVPLVLFVFYMFTSGLRFTLLDERFVSQKTAWAISLSFFPVILNCLNYSFVLYGMDRGGTMQEMLYQQSFKGLSLADMEQVNVILWGGFMNFFLFLYVITTECFLERQREYFNSYFAGGDRQVFL